MRNAFVYVDVPDDKGIYYRWLICDYEEGNQFIKYVILPCDYRFQWIQIINGKKYKRQIWGCTRMLSSYNSGIFVDRYFTSLDNVDKFILPLNKITEDFGYNTGLGDTQRIIVSAKVPRPNVWEVSKIENTKPIGLLKATVKQVPFNDETDYIERDQQGNIIGMYADYFSVDQSEPIDESITPPVPPLYDVTIVITSSSPTIKVNGSYRTITSKFYDHYGNDVTDNYKDVYHNWNMEVVDSDGNHKDADISTKDVEGDKNVIKVKISTKECIGCLLNVGLAISGMSEVMKTPISIIG